MNKKSFCVIAAAIIVITIAVWLSLKPQSSQSSYGLNVHFFAAGKADAILISRTYEDDAEQYNVLIDTGESTLAPTLLAYLSEHSITYLDALIITHFDKDHFGSAAEIIQNLAVRKLMVSNVEKDSDVYRNFLVAAATKGITPDVVAGEDNERQFILGDLSFVVQGPTEVYSKNASNNSSLITKLTFGEQKFLFMGDAENARLKDFYNTALAAETYDFLKVPYHGHYQDRLETLISKTTPTYAVITSSDDEPEDVETLDLLARLGVKTYLTRKGAIDIFSSSGQALTVSQ